MKVEKNFYDSHKDAEGIQGKAVNGARSRSKCAHPLRIRVATRRDLCEMPSSYFYFLLRTPTCTPFTPNGDMGLGNTQPCAIEEDNGQRTRIPKLARLCSRFVSGTKGTILRERFTRDAVLETHRTHL